MTARRVISSRLYIYRCIENQKSVDVRGERLEPLIVSYKLFEVNRSLKGFKNVDMSI